MTEAVQKCSYPGTYRAMRRWSMQDHRMKPTEGRPRSTRMGIHVFAVQGLPAIQLNICSNWCAWFSNGFRVKDEDGMISEPMPVYLGSGGDAHDSGSGRMASRGSPWRSAVTTTAASAMCCSLTSTSGSSPAPTDRLPTCSEPPCEPAACSTVTQDKGVRCQPWMYPCNKRKP